jgi:hypothetical protein
MNSRTEQLASSEVMVALVIEDTAAAAMPTAG